MKPDGVSYGRQELDDFSISQGEPVTAAAHVAFDAPDRASVDAFFEAVFHSPDPITDAPVRAGVP